jgi:SHAQKYF class myb-like DNA-binding protein
MEDSHKRPRSMFSCKLMQNTNEASFTIGKLLEPNNETLTESSIEDRIYKQEIFCDLEGFSPYGNFLENQTIPPTHDSGSIKVNNGRWSSEEHQKFIEAMFLHGNEWKKVQQHIKTRSSTQARSHAQKFFIRLRKTFLHNESEDMDRSTRNSRRNEKIINWIKENVNFDFILKVMNGSEGNATNTLEVHSNEEENDFNFNLDHEHSLSKSKTLFNRDNICINKEAFIAERREKLCKIILDLINNPSRIKKNLGKKVATHVNKQNDQIIDTNYQSMQNINSNNNYYNPNMNSYINIVTINLGCDKTDKVVPDPNQNPQDTPTYFKKNLSRKSMMMEVQKYLKNKTPQTEKPADVFTNNLNSQDPFKISFDESFNNFNNNLNEDNDINKLNVDLDNFFNMDSYP